MTRKEIKLNRTIANLHRFAAGDDARPSLTMVEIGPHAASACDGFFAASVELEDGPQEPVYVHYKDMKRLASLTTQKKRGVTLKEGDDGYVATGDGKAGVQQSVAPATVSTYPTLDDHLTPDGPPRDTVTLSADMLEQVAAFLRTTARNGGAAPHVEIRTRGPEHAVEFFAKTPEGQLVHIWQMPMMGSADWIGPDVEGTEGPQGLHNLNRRIAHDQVEEGQRRMMRAERLRISLEEQAATAQEGKDVA